VENLRETLIFALDVVEVEDIMPNTKGSLLASETWRILAKF
jgi:hypothetical protein